MTATKICLHCLKTYKRSRSVSSTEWCGRKFCSVPCRRAHHKARAAETKPCERCGKPFERRKDAGPTRWGERRFCGNRCASAFGNPVRPAAPCAICSERPARGSGKTCSDTCLSELRRRNRLQQPSPRAGTAAPKPEPKYRTTKQAKGADVTSLPSPLWIIDVPRPEAIRSIVQECSPEFQRDWFESLAPPVRAHVGRVMAGLR